MLGEEVGPPPTRIEKTKTIIALAEVAMRPYGLDEDVSAAKPQRARRIRTRRARELG